MIILGIALGINGHLQTLKVFSSPFYSTVLNFYEKRNEDTDLESRVEFIVNSVAGFFRSIALSTENSLQDALRLLTLWFRYGKFVEVNDAVQEGFKSVSIDTWLQVIPQLIARIDTPISHVRRLIHQVLFSFIVKTISYSQILAKSTPKHLYTQLQLLQNPRIFVGKRLLSRSLIICEFTALLLLSKHLLLVKS